MVYKFRHDWDAGRPRSALRELSTPWNPAPFPQPTRTGSWSWESPCVSNALLRSRSVENRLAGSGTKRGPSAAWLRRLAADLSSRPWEGCDRRPYLACTRGASLPCMPRAIEQVVRETHCSHTPDEHSMQALENSGRTVAWCQPKESLGNRCDSVNKNVVS